MKTGIINLRSSVCSLHAHAVLIIALVSACTMTAFALVSRADDSCNITGQPWTRRRSL